MLLSERKNKRYVIVIDQYDENLGKYTPKSHTVEAPTLVEAIINCDYFRRTSLATHPSRLLSVREAKVYPQSFMDADQHNMISVLKELAHNHPDLVNDIDEFAETFQSYVDTLNLKDCIRDTIDLLNAIPGIDDIDCSLADDCDYVMIEHYSRSLGNLYLSNGTDTRHLTYDRTAKGLDGLAALICGIRDMLRPIA